MMFEKVCGILSDFTEVPMEEMRKETDIANDLGINSLDILGAVMKLGEQFSIRISDRTIGEFLTIGDVVAYLEKIG